jgi:hypothetical protein
MNEPNPLRSPDEPIRPEVTSEPVLRPGPVAPSPDFGPSPYQSPAILPDEEPVVMWGDDPPPPIPVAAAVLFGIFASALSVGGVMLAGNASSSFLTNLFPLAIFFGPLALIGGFVAFSIAYYSANPLLVSKSTGWKILMVLLVPPVSMLVFVPTCVGTTIFMLPMANEITMVFPTFLAYFVCAWVIARRMRWRYAKRLTAD